MIIKLAWIVGCRVSNRIVLCLNLIFWVHKWTHWQVMLHEVYQVHSSVVLIPVKTVRIPQISPSWFLLLTAAPFQVPCSESSEVWPPDLAWNHSFSKYFTPDVVCDMTLPFLSNFGEGYTSLKPWLEFIDGPSCVMAFCCHLCVLNLLLKNFVLCVARSS